MTGTHLPLLGSDLYEIAYLAGGPRRAVEVAVVALIEDGRVRVFRSIAELHVVDTRTRHPVEAAVLDAAGTPARRSIDGIVRRLRPDTRLVGLADGLLQAGLVSRRGGTEATAEWTWTAVGLTRAGRRALHGLRSDPPVVVGRSEALAVALGGRRAWADDALLRAVVFAPPRPHLPTNPGTSVGEDRRSRSGAYIHGGSAGGWAGTGWGGGSGGDCGGAGGGNCGGGV